MSIERIPGAIKPSYHFTRLQSDRPADVAAVLDRIADTELSFGRRRLAERLSQRAAEIREQS